MPYSQLSGSRGISNSYANVHVLTHDIYLKRGTKIAPYAKQLDWSARSMLDKAKLTSNIGRAKNLRRLLNKYHARNQDDDENVEEIFLISGILHEYFEVIADDLMFISAFEMHSKAKLLRKGYLVHEIKKPNTLSKKQRKNPIHKRTIQAMMGKGEIIKISEKSIGIGHLVEKEYLKKYPLSSSVLKGLSEARGRRNLVHFHMSTMIWSVTKDLIEFVEYLDSDIPKHNGVKKRP